VSPNKFNIEHTHTHTHTQKDKKKKENKKEKEQILNVILLLLCCRKTHFGKKKRKKNCFLFAFTEFRLAKELYCLHISSLLHQLDKNTAFYVNCTTIFFWTQTGVMNVLIIWRVQRCVLLCKHYRYTHIHSRLTGSWIELLASVSFR